MYDKLLNQNNIYLIFSSYNSNIENINITVKNVKVVVYVNMENDTMNANNVVAVAYVNIEKDVRNV